jgi:hypothetical protein
MQWSKSFIINRLKTEKNAIERNRIVIKFKGRSRTLKALLNGHITPRDARGRYSKEWERCSKEWGRCSKEWGRSRSRGKDVIFTVQILLAMNFEPN